jgi:hypothetical protein
MIDEDEDTPPLFYFDPIHVLCRLKHHYVNNAIVIGMTHLSHITVIHDFLKIGDSDHWKPDFFLGKQSTGKPATSDFFPITYITQLVQFQRNLRHNDFLTVTNIYNENMNDADFERLANMIDNEINLMLIFVKQVNKVFNRLFVKDLHNILHKNEDDYLQNYFNQISILNESFTMIPTERALKMLLFQVPIELFKRKIVFAPSDLNQWTLEDVYKKIMNLKVTTVQPTKKEFMLFLNKINVMNKEIVDDSTLEFQKTLEHYLPTPRNIHVHLPGVDTWLIRNNENIQINFFSAHVNVCKEYSQFSNIGCDCITFGCAWVHIKMCARIRIPFDRHLPSHLPKRVCCVARSHRDL